MCAFLTSDSSLKSLDDVKIVDLEKNDNALKNSFKTKDLLVNLDQFVLHLKPVYELTKATQSFKGSVYDLLNLLLELISKILTRMGIHLEFCAKAYYTKLYKDKESVIFKASATSTIYSNIPFLLKELCQKSDEELKIITNNWNCFNEYLIKRFLIRFNKFLGSQIVRKMYIIFQSSLVYSDVTIQHLKDLSQRFNLSPTDVADDYAKLRVKITTEFKLINLFLENELTEFPRISKLVECCSVLCPHNMMVESGFSKMKFFEDNYQANFSVDMYNSFRLVADNFSRDAFEDFKPTESLLKLAKSASKMYKDEQSSLQEVEKSDNKKHVEVLVFKRKADKALDRELQEAGKELAEAEIAFVQAKKRKQELEAMKSGVIARRDNVSDEIISSMFS